MRTKKLKGRTIVCIQWMQQYHCKESSSANIESRKSGCDFIMSLLGHYWHYLRTWFLNKLSNKPALVRQKISGLASYRPTSLQDRWIWNVVRWFDQYGLMQVTWRVGWSKLLQSMYLSLGLAYNLSQNTKSSSKTLTVSTDRIIL